VWVPVVASDVVVSLASILSKRTLAPSRLDEMKVKANILNAFGSEEVEDAESAFGRADAEL